MQALAKLQICFQANPKDLDTLDLLARAFGQLGQPRKGIEVQKEMARIAREQKRLDVFSEIVDRLIAVAPNDEGVQELAASRDEVLAQPSEVEEVPEEEELIEEVDSAVIEEVDLVPDPAPSAEPLLLRQSQEATAVDSSQYDIVDAAPEVSQTGEEPVPDLEGNQDPRVLSLISEAQSYRRVRLYDRAVRALIRALEIDGRSIPARAELRDVYLEAGEQDDAVVEMLNIASLQLDALDADGAAQTLQDVLALDPANERAAMLLRELGYEPVEEPHAAQSDFVRSIRRRRGATYDPEAPLPSYDLDEPAPAAQPPAADDDAEPLPSFPLDAAEAPPPVESATAFELVSGNTTAVSPMQPEPPTASYAKPTNDEIEEALEEADFFASRGLFDDAKTVLNEQLARAPSHRLLLERLREIDEQETSQQRGSGTRARPQSAAPSLAPDEFDIAASLEALDALEVAPEAQQMMDDTGQVDVEEVFAQFKEKVSADALRRRRQGPLRSRSGVQGDGPRRRRDRRVRDGVARSEARGRSALPHRHDRDRAREPQAGNRGVPEGARGEGAHARAGDDPLLRDRLGVRVDATDEGSAQLLPARHAARRELPRRAGAHPAPADARHEGSDPASRRGRGRRVRSRIRRAPRRRQAGEVTTTAVGRNSAGRRSLLSRSPISG